MAGTLSSAILWKDDGSGSISDFTPNLLPIDTESVGGCADVQLCSNTNHILVTFRPGKSSCISFVTFMQTHIFDCVLVIVMLGGFKSLYMMKN